MIELLYDLEQFENDDELDDDFHLFLLLLIEQQLNHFVIEHILHLNDNFYFIKEKI
jgi:hypothetical protein